MAHLITCSWRCCGNGLTTPSRKMSHLPNHGIRFAGPPHMTPRRKARQSRLGKPDAASCPQTQRRLPRHAPEGDTVRQCQLRRHQEAEPLVVAEVVRR